MHAFIGNLRRQLLHPWYLLALTALVVNDRALKAAFPGLVTGKLSDVAGVFVVAVALGAVLRHRASAVALTGVGFAAIKLSAGAALLAAPILGGVTLQDSTDLLALFVLIPAFRFLGRELEQEPSVARSEPLGSHLDRLAAEQLGPIDARLRPTELTSRVGLILALSSTAFAVTATSCIGPSGYFSFLVVPDGVVALGDNELPAHISADGGRTWQPWQESFNGQPPVADEACLDGDRCFRVVDYQRVEERTGDGWTTAFEFDQDELDAIAHKTGDCGDPTLFRSIIALDAGTAGSADSTVLVAMGNEGVIRLDTATGSWERIGVGEAQPKDLNTWVPSDLVRTIAFLTPLLVAALSPALLFIRYRSAAARWRVSAFVVTLIAALGLLVLSFISSLSLGTSPSWIFRFAVIMAAAAVAVGAVALATVLLAPRSSADPPVAAPPVG